MAYLSDAQFVISVNINNMTVKLLFYTAILIFAIFGYRNYAAASIINIQIGNDAPEFSLNDAQGKPHSLHDYAGKYLVLYFYPKDDTPGCTKEACNFRDDITKFEKLGVNVIGISVDDIHSHEMFAKKYHLPFPLLADPSGKVANSYNALTNLFVVKIAKRYTFLISPAGKITKIYKSVDTSNHSQQIIDDLKLILGKQ
jgi:thioredoxin-dependent peroxiredoxin